MGIEELRRSFIVDDETFRAQLEPMVGKVAQHCLITSSGQVHIKDNKLPAARQVMLVLAARAIASRLETEIPAEVSVAEISKFTGLPGNQVRARGKDLIKARVAESPSRGVYRALFHKVDNFLNEIAA